MFGLDTTVARIIGGILLVAGLFGFGYYQGYSGEKEKFDLYKAEVAVAAEQQAQKAKEIDAKNQKLFQETKNAYNTQLTALRNYYSMRLAQGGGTLSGTTPTAPGTAAKAIYDLPALPPVDTLAAQCAETTLTLVQLQKWVQDAQ